MPHVDDGATVHVDTINTDVHAAEATLDAALAEHQALPARLPLAEVHPGQQVLDTETKPIHHAIRIAAFNTVQSLARAIVTGTGYTRADDEAHTLIRTALAGSGDISPTTTPCISGSTRSPRHGTPPPSTNSAAPSMTSTPSTPAPA